MWGFKLHQFLNIFQATPAAFLNRRLQITIAGIATEINGSIKVKPDCLLKGLKRFNRNALNSILCDFKLAVPIPKRSPKKRGFWGLLVQQSDNQDAV
jgi:hypothetical protein